MHHPTARAQLRSRSMLTIGFPGFLAFASYAILFGLFWRLAAYSIANRNENSAIAKAMLFVF